MSLLYNYQIFPNVATVEDLLGNIKLVASSNGWTIDKDDIATNQELYLHNTGNGSQNLYFSLKGSITSTQSETNNATRINVYGNTGFDTGLTVDAQPGRYTNNSCDMIVQFPIIKQYILANSTNLLSVFDYNFSGYYYSPRLLPHLFIGAIDTYKTNETEGNFAASTVYTPADYDEFTDIYFNAFHQRIYSTYPYPAGLFYNGIKQNTADNKVKVGMYYFSSVTLSAYEYIYPLDYQYPRYDGMVKYNTTVSRTTLIKPIIYLNYSGATDTYDYPIGEFPYYACKAYPYSKAGDIITAGTRNFMVFPLLQYTDGNGVAFEVNT